MALVFLLAGVSFAGQALWQIGEVDGDYAEFAVAADHAAFAGAFASGVDFKVGQDRAQDGWPYIHPGPSDAWAGGRVHPFKINFDAPDADSKYYRLAVHVVAAQGSASPVLTVDLNGRQQSAATKAGPHGDQALTDAALGDPQVYSFLFSPGNLLPEGNVITLTTTRSWMLYDAIVFEGFESGGDITGLKASVRRGWYKQPDGASRQIHLEFLEGLLVAPATVKVDFDGQSFSTTVNPDSEALMQADVLVPMEEADETVNATLTLDLGDRQISTAVAIPPERRWEIHLVHQTHLDIGYTDTQENVLKHQVDHLYKALDYIDDSSDEPEWATFKWHPEGMWAVDEFMRTASEENKARFIKATQDRQVHIDSLYAQAMTGAYSEEELFELMGASARYSRDHGVQVNSAMQSDVPGYSWGLVSALAHHGIKYISAGPNGGHRVGHTFEWGDQPFYWVSPSGKQRVLFWMAGKGYSWFHGMMPGSTIDETKILDYLDSLDAKDYPYDLVLVRYNIGFDNGPPNPALVQTVKDWNEKYLYPRMVISRNSDAIEELEERYGDELPVVSGDFTPYWEDGMASTSADVGLSRRAAERLVQAQNLWSMLDPAAFPHEAIDQAWVKLIMYDEHTWGAHNSISAPDSPFAVRQAEYKQRYALDGYDMANQMLTESVASHALKASSVIDVYNTLNWSRTSVVMLSPAQSEAGDCVLDSKKRPVPSQRLASGELAFLATDVPPFAASRFTVCDDAALAPGDSVSVTGDTLANGRIAVKLNTQTGAIQAINHADIPVNLVDGSKDYGVNDYLYILGRDDSKNHMRISSPVSITIEDAGPLVGTLRVESSAPGAKGLVRRVRLFADSDQVFLYNVVDKLKVRDPEGVYFNFPFNVPTGVMKIDTPWAVYQPEVQQLRGANKNFFVVQRFVDISNDNYGMTLMSLDAPIVQWDPIKIAPAAWGPQHFRMHINPNQTLHSWVMNNHWETNYKADQEGLIPFQYVLDPHAGGYDAVATQREARAIHQPLIAVPADAEMPVESSLLRMDANSLMVTSIKQSRDGEALLVRLYNGSEAETAVGKLRWGKQFKVKKVYVSNPMGDKVEKFSPKQVMVPSEILTLRVDYDEKKQDSPWWKIF